MRMANAESRMPCEPERARVCRGSCTAWYKIFIYATITRITLNTFKVHHHAACGRVEVVRACAACDTTDAETDACMDA